MLGSGEALTGNEQAAVSIWSPCAPSPLKPHYILCFFTTMAAAEQQKHTNLRTQNPRKQSMRAGGAENTARVRQNSRKRPLKKLLPPSGTRARTAHLRHLVVTSFRIK
ncbi:hypothetical protein ACFX2B_013044 [Malus domestica]